MFVEWFCRDICRPPVFFCCLPAPPPPPLAPQPIPLPPTATISLNPSVLELALLKCKHCMFCAPVFVFCTRNKHGGARRSSRYGRIPCTAVMIMIDISSLEHVLKCLTRQNVLTELTLDSSLESLDINIMFCFLEQLPLLATHVPECWFSFQSTQLLTSQAPKLVPSPLAIENSKIAQFKT